MRAAAAQRRSIRKYAPDPIPDADLRAIIDTAMSAPSPMNVQPWRFVVVREPVLKAKLQAAANNQAHRRKKSPTTPSLLCGIVCDVHGVRFTPTHATKNRKRYRYYTSQAAIQKPQAR